MGLYANSAGVPGTLVADYGVVGSGITGIRSITGLSTPVRPVLNWLVIARQGGLLNLGLSARDTWDPIVSETTPVLAANVNAYYRDGVSGALPASFGAVAGTIQSPSLSVQLT
jgi:energy-converting hydrogenase Eha subunit A